MNKKEAEAFARKLDFEKSKGLVVAIAQDADTGEVLMQAFMNREALLRTLTSGEMWYYSRSRGRLWKKGETSGCIQRVIDFSSDCDLDAVLFRVVQIGNACHMGKTSCFSEFRQQSFSIGDLARIIMDRKKNPCEGSYTCKLLGDEKLLLEKIREESGELIEAAEDGKKGEIVWEACDLLYHMFVLLAEKGITLNDVCNELRRRRR